MNQTSIDRASRYFLLALLAASFTPACLFAQSSPQRPNVILLITDDQGYPDLGCHGNSMIRTPHLDRLHSQSLRLTNYHVDPTCSPTRSALMTGRYSTRTGVWHTIAGRSILRRQETTMPEVFARSGYRTGMFGKWHLGDNFPFRPQDRGFQESVVHGGGGVGQTPDFWGNDYFDDTYWHNGQPQKFSGYCTDVFFESALKFIEANRQQPFFCYLATNAPHGPYNVDAKYSRPYVEKGVPQPMANFYGMIENIDENVGRLRAKLREWGIEQNTLLIFTTDNGTAAGVGARQQRGGWSGYSAGMRGTKGSEYDGGHRVPCFLHWPAKWNSARDLSALTAHIDLLPTLIDLCGLQRPHDVDFDGTSLAGLLAGRQLPERTLFVHSQRIEMPEKWRKSAVMTQRWRLVNGAELFDMAADPSQSKDLSTSHPEVVRQLRAEYDSWWSSLTPRFAEFSEIVLGDPAAETTTLTCHDWHSDTVPWSHQAVRQAPFANGFWAIEVARAGKYEFTLRQQPEEAKFAISASSARVQVGAVEQSAPVGKEATSAVLVLELPQGKARLQTWLTDASGKSRGAFFVTVRRLP